MTDREAGAADRFLPESPLVGGQGGMPAVRLVRRGAAGPDGEPFVVLHEGRFSRVLLAELLDAGGRPLQRVAWKLRRDSVGPPATAGSAVPNGAVDAMWARERAELARVRSPQVLGPVPVPPGLLASPPVWYCRRREVCFHPVSPSSGARLRVCRDDAVLTRHGLPAYALAGERLLYDGSAGAPPVFYRASAGPDVDRLPGGAVVGSARQLVRDLARLVHAPVGNAAADLPCVTCEHRRTCYPEAAAGATLPAERELHVVSFHEVEAEALELREFDLGEAIALLGGADVAAVLTARLPGRAEALPAATVARLAQGPQWLFAADPQRWVREVLRQKLGLFLEVCEGLAAVHATGRPHLALAPAHVLVSRSGRGARRTPVRWQACSARAGSTSAAPQSVASRRRRGALRGRHVARAGRRDARRRAACGCLPGACCVAGRRRRLTSGCRSPATADRPGRRPRALRRRGATGPGSPRTLPRRRCLSIVLPAERRAVGWCCLSGGGASARPAGVGAAAGRRPVRCSGTASTFDARMVSCHRRLGSGRRPARPRHCCCCTLLLRRTTEQGRRRGRRGVGQGACGGSRTSRRRCGVEERPLAGPPGSQLLATPRSSAVAHRGVCIVLHRRGRPRRGEPFGDRPATARCSTPACGNDRAAGWSSRAAMATWPHFGFADDARRRRRRTCCGSWSATSLPCDPASPATSSLVRRRASAMQAVAGGLCRMRRSACRAQARAAAAGGGASRRPSRLPPGAEPRGRPARCQELRLRSAARHHRPPRGRERAAAQRRDGVVGARGDRAVQPRRLGA
jgi:hypothetical protein